MSVRRTVAAVLLVLFVALGPAGRALADPAGPTDYRSEVVTIDPPTPTITMQVLGGDSFVELEVAGGTEAIVVGYQGEDYLWFRPDGVVLENRNAPSTYTNEDRYGGGEIPPSASADAEPEWDEVATGGRYAWHDHRAHWMQTSRPFGLGPGDQILEANIPLVVDGEEVDVAVISTWVASPSPIPVILGALLGAVAALGNWLLGRGARSSAADAAPTVPAAADEANDAGEAIVAVARVMVVLPVVLAAVAAGWWQYLSLPSETGPKLTWWLLPTIAAVCLIAAFVGGLRRQPLLAHGALLLVGVELFVWGLVKRDGLTAALIPTDAPGWFDRLATTAALVGGAGIAIVAVLALFTATRAPAAPSTPSRNLRPASR